MDGTRLDGWKAISAYLRRDRSTVMRWSRERGLPVRRVPGGKQASVYALTAELDRWIGSADGLEDDGGRAGAGDAADAAEAPAPGPPPGHAGRLLDSRPRTVLAVTFTVGVAVALGVMASASLTPTRPEPESAAVPASPELARLYLSAREKWSQRTPASLAAAIHDFEMLTRRDPGFAPGFVGLAECYLLAREFGSVPNAVAYARAEQAARAALALDSRLYSAHRALGFVAYWWKADPQAAGRAFRTALALAPDEPQTLYWYANVLADNGEADESLRLFARVIAMAPGRMEVALDHAWAQWSAGHDDVADKLLRQIGPQAENNAVYQAIVGDFRLIRGDWAGYVTALERHGALRADAQIRRDAADLRAAMPRGEASVAALALAQALA